MIKLEIIGNLGRDAVVTNVNGKNVINFSVCHTESYKDVSGNKVQKSVWVDAAYWSDKTGIVPYLKKGAQVYVEGQPDSRAYSNRQGMADSTITLRVHSIQLLSSSVNAASGNPVPSASVAAGNEQPQQRDNTQFVSSTPINEVAAEQGDVIDDLPF